MACIGSRLAFCKWQEYERRQIRPTGELVSQVQGLFVLVGDEIAVLVPRSMRDGTVLEMDRSDVAAPAFQGRPQPASSWFRLRRRMDAKCGRRPVLSDHFQDSEPASPAIIGWLIVSGHGLRCHRPRQIRQLGCCRNGNLQEREGAQYACDPRSRGRASFISEGRR
jgi:hypothetical protein